MRITKLLSLIFSFALIIVSLLSATGCNSTEIPTCTEHIDSNGDGICDNDGCTATVAPSPEAADEIFNENGELILFKEGTPTFSFILGKDAVSKYSKKIKELAETLALYTKEGAEPEIKNYSSEPTAVEILVGSFDNRGDDYTINKYEYGSTGYAVKQIGTKIVVLGGSDKALEKAIEYLKETVFGIRKHNDPFGTFVMASDKNCSVIQTGYALEDIKINSNSIRDYVIAYESGDATSKANATTLQTLIYEKTGIRPETMLTANAAGKGKILIRSLTNDGEGGGFYINVDKDNNLTIECEYNSKSADLITSFFEDEVFKTEGIYNFPEGFSHAPNLRDVNYSEYGAIGDGVADDFFALKAAHDDANLNMLNVHADPDAKYYIGNANGTYTINIRSNTYWHGCQFIFDDEMISYDDPGRETNIFGIRAHNGSQTYYKNNSPIKSLEKGSTNIGWAPGKAVMIAVYQKDIRHYIRYGANASQSSDPTKWGQPQHELILVDKDGNVDPSTPIQWTYTEITSLEVYQIDDRPIEIRGEGADGRRTVFTTRYNNGPNAYFYYKRNIDITRSNVLISGLEHKYTNYVPYEDGGHGSPYSGFIRVSNSNNVVIDNMVYECPPGYKDVDPDHRPSGTPNITKAGMGSYEIGAALSNNVTWSNSTQSNFFQPDGGIKYEGSMGSNFCKNLTFDNMFTCSFDAHCGVYNGTIKNSTLEHINFIGDGLITLENVTVYADANKAAINLREDYGSWWAGDIYIDGLIFKVHDKKNPKDLRIVKVVWNNWDFGYVTYLPQNITLKNVLTAEYTYELVGAGNGTNNRIESNKYVYNELQVRAFTSTINESAVDLSLDTYYSLENKNPMIATKSIHLYTTYTGKYAELGITKPLNFIAPSGPFFKNMKYYIDDVLQ